MRRWVGETTWLAQVGARGPIVDDFDQDLLNLGVALMLTMPSIRAIAAATLTLFIANVGRNWDRAAIPDRRKAGLWAARCRSDDVA